MSEKDFKQIKDWFLNTRVVRITDVPLSYVLPLYSIGLIDDELCDKALKSIALELCIDAEVRKIDKLIASGIDSDFKKTVLSALIKGKELFWAVKKGAKPTPYQLSALKDMYQKAQVFYSKPLMTISDLGTIAGVDGAPYY